ncbi:MAG: thiol:disulfide interchange protein TlpA [Rhodoblastus sp.]
MTEHSSRQTPRKSRTIIIGAALVAAAVGVLYGILAPAGKKGTNQCAASKHVLAEVAAQAKGAVAAAIVSKQPQAMETLDFFGPDNRAMTLADFRDRVILVNLWATWCVPCREEMPALDKLQAKLGSKDFEVVAINIDTARLERAREFLKEISVKTLAFYHDPKADVFYRLRTAGKVVGLPSTFLVGRDGCEIAAMSGPADWASEDAMALIRAAVQR